jgi:hypothetical protein
VETRGKIDTHPEEHADTLRTIAEKMGLTCDPDEIPHLYKSGNGDCWFLSTRYREGAKTSQALGPAVAGGFNPANFLVVPGMGGLASTTIGRQRLEASMRGVHMECEPTDQDEWGHALAALVAHYGIEPSAEIPLSEGALVRLRCLATYKDGWGWFSGDISWELRTRGFCDIETVTNPDGTPGGGAYYTLLDAGRDYYKAHLGG